MFTVGAIASGLGRVKKIASAYPKLFVEVFEYPQGSKSSAEILDMLASVQQAFNSGGSVDQFPQSFVADATVEGKALPSVAAIERTVRDIEPEKYFGVLRRTGLRELDKLGMLAQEKSLVEAGYLKDAKRLWKKLPSETRTNLAAIGITGAKPWDLYQPAPENPPNAVIIRLLNWLEDVRSESERLRKSRSINPDKVAPVVLWRLAGLEKWRPPSAILPKFTGPVGGYMSPSAVVSWALRARMSAKKNDIPQLQIIEKKFGPRGVRWLIEGAPSLESFVKAFDFRSDKGSALGFDRVVSLSREYWDVMPLELCECPGEDTAQYLAPAGMKELVDPMKIPPALLAPGGGFGPVGPAALPPAAPPPPNGNGNGGDPGDPGDGGFPPVGPPDEGAPEPAPLPSQPDWPLIQPAAAQQQPQVPSKPVATKPFVIPQPKPVKKLTPIPIPQTPIIVPSATKSLAPPSPAATLQKVTTKEGATTPSTPVMHYTNIATTQAKDQPKVQPVTTVPGVTDPSTSPSTDPSMATTSPSSSSNVNYATAADFEAAKKALEKYQAQSSR